MKDKNSLLFIISFCLNLLIFILVLIGTIIAFIVGDGILTATFPDIFKYFTFQSNIFMAVVAFIYAYYQFLVLKQKKENIPHVLAVFYHVAVTQVGLTFFIVIFFLAPGYGFDKMYNYANLFFHALVPVISMINFMFLTNDLKLKFRETPFSIIPSFLYGVVYFIIVASLNAYGDINIDFYMFGQNGPLIGAFNFFSVMSIAYIIGVIIFFINRLMFKKRK